MQTTVYDRGVVDDTGTWCSYFGGTSVDIQPTTEGRIFTNGLTYIRWPYDSSLQARTREQFDASYLENEAILHSSRKMLNFPIGDAIRFAASRGADMTKALELHYENRETASACLKSADAIVEILNQVSDKTGFSYEIVRVMSRWGYIRYLYLDRAEAAEAEVADTR